VEGELLQVSGETAMVKLIVVFRNSAKAPKSQVLYFYIRGQLKYETKARMREEVRFHSQPGHGNSSSTKRPPNDPSTQWSQGSLSPGVMRWSVELPECHLALSLRVSVATSPLHYTPSYHEQGQTVRHYSLGGPQENREHLKQR
jgi:hypothetical protein